MAARTMNRPRLALVVLLGFGVAVAVGGAVRCGLLLRQDNPEPFADYDGPRYDAVRPVLAPGATVGYVEDRPPGERSHYYLTQYGLAPAVVVEGPDAPLVLVNGRAEEEPAAARARGWRLLRDAGNGVRLYRVEGR